MSNNLMRRWLVDSLGRRTLLAVAVMATWLTSCSPDDRTPVYAVRGVITVEGAPAANAQVMFHPLDPLIMQGLQIKPMGIAGEDGRFSITSYETGDGAPAGEYAVTIEWRGPSTDPFGGGTPDKLNGRFADRQTTPLRARVAAEPNELPPFALNFQ